MKICGRKALLAAALALAMSLCPLAAHAEEPAQTALPLQWTEYGSSQTFTLTAPEAGSYALVMEYRAFESRSDFIELDVQVQNGQNALSLEGATLERPLEVLPIRQDSEGNDLRGGTELADVTVRRALSAPAAPDTPWQMELAEGEVTVTVTAKRADFELLDLALEPVSESEAYAGPAEGYSPAGEAVVVQAEAVSTVSTSTLGAQYDRGGPSVQPSDPGRLVLNIAGGENWNQAGQWMEWQVEVPETGLYAVRFKARQNIKSGLASNRRLLVDGAVPCAEAEDIVFPYSADWQMVTLSTAEGEEVLLPLEAGTHTLRLEVVSGPTASAVTGLRTALNDLNGVYRQIVMVTGVNPDKNRDYSLGKLIPTLADDLAAGKAALEEQMAALEALAGQEQGDEMTTLNTLIVQLGSFVEDTESIPLRLANFKSNLDNLATWLNTLSQQPLELDYLVLDVPGSGREAEKAGFWENLVFSVKGLWASFFHNYDTTGSNENAQLEVWVGAGRDQMQILQEMIDETFTPATGITVQLSMVQQGVAEAVLAGEGPDAVFFAGNTEPANLAMRGALEPLDDYPGFEELKEQFQSQSFVPYEYDGLTYGVPFTQQFSMLFYRTDIFEELGLEVPKTWEDLFGIIPVLQRKNMQVGVPSSDQTFATLLFQQGGQYYNEDATATALGDNTAVEVFRQYTRLFSDYDLPLSYDFFNRFCSGEMPLAIADYTEYNRLTVAAPQISGLWEMALLPGTEQEDGSIDRSTLAGAGQGGYILATSEHKDEAWQLLQWFASAEAQAEFGKRSEAVLGSAGRYAAANQEAFRQLPWLADEQELLMTQWEAVRENPQPPGCYYMQRNLTNAFRQVVLDGQNPREMLDRYMDEVDRELERKRMEYSDIYHG